MNGNPAVAPAINVAAITHRGQVRPRNEDAVAVGADLLIGDMDAPRTSQLGAPQVIMVADGMGGHARGELASRTALKALSTAARLCGDDVISWAEALEDANNRLYDLMLQRPDVQGLGTTVVGVSFTSTATIVFNIGDSRAYRFAMGRLTRLSHDDVPGGTTGQGQRLHHQITQSLGGRISRTRVFPHVFVAPMLQKHELIMICSDGLTDMLDDEDIATILQNELDPEQAAAQLFGAAMRAGGEDNISVVVANAVSGVPSAPNSQRTEGPIRRS